MAVSGKAQGDYHEFLEANAKNTLTPLSTSTVHRTWVRPPINTAKITVDAAVPKRSNTSGTRAIARGGNGEVLGISLNSYTGVSSPRVAEAMAIRDGTQLGIALKLSRVIIESDSELVMRNCLASTEPSDVSVLVHDCILLKQSFEFCEFSSIKHECNRYVIVLKKP